MSIGDSDLIAIDTSALVHWVRQDATGRHLLQRYLLDAYADLYFEDQHTGHKSGQNDLWIAATAKATGAVLLTCDGDFVWMSPRLIRVEHVPQVK